MHFTERPSRTGDDVADSFAWYLGIDWGSEEHHLCLLNATGQVCGTRAVAHTAAAIHDALRWVRECTDAVPADIAVGLETPRGALVDTLLEQGFCVFALNPKQLDRFRDRFSIGGAKDDPRDAHVAADALRTDRRAFRRVRADDPMVIHLRELCRIVEELQVEEGRLINRLREQLYRVNAPWLTLCPAADEPWLWAVLGDTPDPTAWPQLARRRIGPALRAHRIRRLTADAVVTVLRQPTLAVAPGVADAVATRITSLIPQLVLVHHQRGTAERQIDRILEKLPEAEHIDSEPREHRDVDILRSLPGVGRFVAATMLTEAAGPLAERDYATLRAHAGTAPVTKRSGKRAFFVHMRYACKWRLRQALYHWSRVSIQRDQATRTYYDTLRSRGHGHGRALRSIADRWLRILVAMLTTGTLYDASRFTRVASETP
jgi:transposase